MNHDVRLLPLTQRKLTAKWKGYICAFVGVERRPLSCEPIHRAQRPSGRKFNEDRERDQCSVIKWSRSRHLQVETQNEDRIVILVVVVINSCCWLSPCKHIVAQAVCSHLKRSIVSISQIPRDGVWFYDWRSYRMVPQICIHYEDGVRRDHKLCKLRQDLLGNDIGRTTFVWLLISDTPGAYGVS